MSKVKTGKYTSEAVAGFTHRTAMEEAARCLLCHDAPCSEGCPAGTNPGDFIRSIRFRNVKGAVETIRDGNVMGATCANVCPYDKLCEEACSRCGIDRPIEIGKLQRYAMEQEKALKMKTLKAPASKKKEKIACVGAGPASLACAAELAKEGYKVTIFEKEAKAGGVCSYGITASRLPQKTVDQDIAVVKGLGVKFEFGKEIGKKATVEDLLKEGFDAVFVGAGLWQARKPAIPGSELKNSLAAVDFLKDARKKNGVSKVKGKSVVVIGGGDVAIDCAVTAKLSGAEKVAIWYRRTLEEAPANMDEWHYALSLGITVTTNMAPDSLEGDSKVKFAKFVGRDKKSEAKIAADFVVFAIGQGAEDMSKVSGAKLTEKGTIKATKTGKTNVKGVYAAGDIVNGGNTVVQAVKEGKDAAAEIAAYLDKKGVK